MLNTCFVINWWITMLLLINLFIQFQSERIHRTNHLHWHTLFTVHCAYTITTMYQFQCTTPTTKFKMNLLLFFAFFHCCEFQVTKLSLSHSIKIPQRKKTVNFILLFFFVLLLMTALVVCGFFSASIAFYGSQSTMVIPQCLWRFRNRIFMMYFIFLSAQTTLTIHTIHWNMVFFCFAKFYQHLNKR